MPPRRRSLDTRGRFGRYPPLTKIPRANKSDVADSETRAREPRGPVEGFCRPGNIRAGGYIGAVCGNFAAPFRPPLPWASRAPLAKLQGTRIGGRAVAYHTTINKIHSRVDLPCLSCAARQDITLRASLRTALIVNHCALCDLRQHRQPNPPKPPGRVVTAAPPPRAI